MPADRTRHSQRKNRLFCSEASKIRAHQYPPRPDDTTTNTLANDETGVELNMPLSTARTARMAEITISPHPTLIDRVFFSRITAPRQAAQSRPVNTLERMFGKIRISGVRNAAWKTCYGENEDNESPHGPTVLTDSGCIVYQPCFVSTFLSYPSIPA